MAHNKDGRSKNLVQGALLPPTREEISKLAEWARALPPGMVVKDVPERRTWSLRRRFGPEKIASVVAGYKDGASIAALSREYGADPTSIQRLLLSEGVKVRRRRRKGFTRKQVETIVERYESGLTIREVAKELGSFYSSIRRVLHAEGVSLREDAFGRKGGRRG